MNSRSRQYSCQPTIVKKCTIVFLREGAVRRRTRRGGDLRDANVSFARVCPRRRRGGGSTALGIMNGSESLPTWSMALSGLMSFQAHYTQQQLQKKDGKHPTRGLSRVSLPFLTPRPRPRPLALFSHTTHGRKWHKHSCTLTTQVNEKFDQLLQVLEEAEATSGLEPPAAKEGKTAAHACINGRRVEVLSRTIQVVKKLLQERREALAGVPPPAADTFAAVAGGSNGWQEEETAEGLVLDGGFRSEVEENSPPPLATETAAPAASTHDGIDSNEAAGEGVDAQAEAAVAASSATDGAAANHQALMHHVAMPVSGHHASMIMAPGFTGVPGHHVPAPQNGIPGHPGGPIFFAVPMYIPQGQGMPAAATAAVEDAAQAPAATTVTAPSLAATPAAAAEPAPTPVAETAAAPGVVGATEAVPAPSDKKTWAVPAGMGYQSMMTLQMPQFVTQALSAEEGNEKPTHAVCA